MSLAGKGIFIIGAKRTPFCNYGGPLRDVQACHLFAAAAKDAIRAANIEASVIDQTVVGNVNYLSQCDGGKTPRYCGIYSGLPIERPALGVSKACGTGIQAVISGAVDIVFGTSNVCLSGGTEQMSSLPMLVRKLRFGTALGASYQFEDHIQREFLDSHTGRSLQRMAEETSKKYGIGRKNVDDYTVQSYDKWKEAVRSKLFINELTSLSVKIKKKDVLVEADQPCQLDVSVESLNALPALIDNGDVVTAGNSAVGGGAHGPPDVKWLPESIDIYNAPADGAAALVLASEESVLTQNLKPLARLVGWTTVGVDPQDTAAGAIEAVRKLLIQHKYGVNDVDLFEINEVFASQALIAAIELKLDVSKLNVNGGALAFGNPVAATGARMIVHLVHELRRRNLKRAVAASSCGGGQGVAVLLENTG